MANKRQLRRYASPEVVNLRQEGRALPAVSCRVCGNLELEDVYDNFEAMDQEGEVLN